MTKPRERFCTCPRCQEMQRRYDLMFEGERPALPLTPGNLLAVLLYSLPPPVLDQPTH